MTLNLIQKLMEHVDIEEIARDVMVNLTLTDLDIYFVVEKWDGEDQYNFLGMAYSEDAARKLADAEDADGERARIFHIDMGQVATLARRAGVAKEINRLDF